MTIVVAAAVVLVLFAAFFLAMLVRSHSTGLEIAMGCVAMFAAVIALLGTWSVYRRVAARSAG